MRRVAEQREPAFRPGRQRLAVVERPAEGVVHLREHLVERLDDPDICWLLPAAHDHVWYPAGFMAPAADNQPGIDHSLEAIDRIALSLAHRPDERIVWAGFSQGACLVSEWVARHPRRWGALLAFTGGRLGPEGTEPVEPAKRWALPQSLRASAAGRWRPKISARMAIAAAARPGRRMGSADCEEA